jgi:hypothetical protein
MRVKGSLSIQTREVIMKGSSYVQLIGSLTRDPELRYTPSGLAILEEVRLYGLSRSVNPEIIKGKLSPSSKILLVHARAILKNAAALYSYLENNRLRFRCALYNTRTNLEHLKMPEAPCTRHSYALAPATAQKQLGQRALFIREFTPHTVYAVELLWPGAPEPGFTMGIIAALPITNISVVAADDGSHLQTVEDLRQALPDFNVEESDY